MQQARLYDLALLATPGVGHGLYKTLISYCGSAEAVFKANFGKLIKIPGIGETIARTILAQKTLTKAEEEFRRCEKANVRLLFFTDADYPKRLKQIYDAPSLLYYQGTANLNHSKVISIVGTRKATGYGREITQQIVRDLAPHQPLIVSGLAYGIDIEAHRMALECGLSTVGVMASGVNVIYPSAHQSTAHRMKTQGGLMSENPLDAKPDAPKFPARNRIIAGLADATLVVEAAEKGGALITAKLAADYDRDVFAVPGNLQQPASAGCLALIEKQLAQIYTGIEGLEFALQWQAGEDHHPPQEISLEGLSESEKRIAELLLANPEGLPIDEISWKTQLPVGQVASLLLNLEFQGMIKPLPGKKYRLLA